MDPLLPLFPMWFSSLPCLFFLPIFPCSVGPSPRK
ncbi:late embryogenesis abundant protein [Zea mays]|uniref:Late embryogenesis abundant protein n=1 Tax=Zea mays TaxID=4577 RepID=A0A1D6NC91_MAIZE|nr:late embryogenesis abundant protein [Zea mays]